MNIVEIINLLVVMTVTRLCLSDPMDCSLPDSSVHRVLNFKLTGKNTGVGSLLQGILLTQGSNLGLLECKQATGEALVKISVRLSFLPLLISCLLLPLATTN